MSKEIRINPKTIRKVSVKGEDRYQHYVTFIAKGAGEFWRYDWRYNEDATNPEDTLCGPTFDRFSDRFIINNGGQWEKIQPGCSGLIKYYLSPRMKARNL